MDAASVDAGGADEERATRAGYVALVGRPNVGKSTLLNALTGEKLSIVTARAQTTRQQVLGIYTGDREQLIFVDTPGLLEAKYLLQAGMQDAALAAVRDADLVLLLLDGCNPGESVPTGSVCERLRARGPALQVAVNKVDEADAAVVAKLAAWTEREVGRAPYRISALLGTGILELREALAAALPESPFLYPADDVAVQPVRFFVAELIRETIFESYRDEVPYSTAVRVDEFREAGDPVYIRATVIVERDSQKAILIGKGGSGIRELGRSAREKVEALLDARVYLDLWVKAIAGWRKKPDALRRLGYPAPPKGRS